MENSLSPGRLSRLSETLKMKEEKFESEIWDIWLKVHNDIPPIRKETYKLLAAWKRMKLEEKSENENAD